MDFTEYTKEENELIEMAQKIRQYVDKNRNKMPNMDKEMKVDGIIIFGDNAEYKAYMRGQNDEKRRIKNFLGLRE